MGDQLRIVVTLPVRETIHLANNGEPLADVMANILNRHRGLRGMCDGRIEAKVVPDVPESRSTGVEQRKGSC